MALRSKSMVGRIISSIPNKPHLAPPKSRCGHSAPAAATTTHSSSLSEFLAPEAHRAAPSGDGVIRRFLHQLGARTGRNHSLGIPLQGRLGLLAGDSVMEKLRGLGAKRVPILDALGRPPIPPDIEDVIRGDDDKEKAPASVSVPVTTRLAAWTVKEKLRTVPDGSITYADFLRICREVCGGEEEDATAVARALDDSGAVIVIGSLVFVRPEQVVQALETAMAPHCPKLEKRTGDTTIPTVRSTTTTEAPNPTASSSELRELDAQLGEIDARAAAGARRELWTGLMLLMTQTVGFARLTFWELSWDVMEPVCFYVTSLYFMAGYAFFLRTDKDPSFEGVFQIRFQARRRRLIRDTGFPLQRYEELRRQEQWGNLPAAAAVGVGCSNATTLPPSMTMSPCAGQLRPCQAWSSSPHYDASSSPSCFDCRRRLV